MPPKRNGLPLIVKFSLLAFGGLLVVAMLGGVAAVIGGGHDGQPTLAERGAACEQVRGGPFDNLRYPYVAESTRPEYPPLNLDVPAALVPNLDTRTVSLERSDNSYKMLGTALVYRLGDDASLRDEFIATNLTGLRADGITPRLTVLHDHDVYRFTRPTKDPNNIVLGTTSCGALLVLSDTDHAASALWRRLAEPPAEGRDQER